MGLFSKLRGEFIDIIDWVDNTDTTLVWKFPRYQNEIKMNAKLTVRESQLAVFMNEGQFADVFLPGLHTLQTQNMPIMTTLKGWKYGFDSPFKADVFFVSTKRFIDNKWGTKNAIIVNDDRFGMIELRAFGNFCFKITDPTYFIKEISGTNEVFTVDQVNDQLRTLIVSQFTDMIGEGAIPIEKFAANLVELSELCSTLLAQRFTKYGLEISDFMIENISMPDEIKKEIFEYSRLNKIDMQKLTHFKAAQSIEKAAENPGGGMGMGVGVGMGMGMNQMIANSMNTTPQSAPPPIPSEILYHVAVNGQQTGPFSVQQLNQMVGVGTLNASMLVWKQGMSVWKPAGQIDELMPMFSNTPPPLPQ